MREFDLIRRLQEIICAPIADDAAGCRVGIGDDGAVLAVPQDRELVVCTDTLVGGVHFPRGTEAGAIGHKALAVNLSDLAAMGAEPAWFFMALTLPSAEREWLEAFAGGMGRLASESGAVLAGGDVTTGPLSVTVTAMGLAEPGRSLLRSGAAGGDLIVVSGTPGAAAHALQRLKQGSDPAAADRAALDFPVPRLGLGRALRDLATSCIDVSDGLAADLGHLLEASNTGADVDLDRLPCPKSLSGMEAKDRWPLQLSGGDDYELCFTVPPGSQGRLAEISGACGVRLSVIGAITAQAGLRFHEADGSFYEPPRGGYQHFDPGQEERRR